MVNNNNNASKVGIPSTIVLANYKNVGPIPYSDNSKDVWDLLSLLMLFCSGCIAFYLYSSQIEIWKKKIFTPEIALSLLVLCEGSVKNNIINKRKKEGNNLKLIKWY